MGSVESGEIGHEDASHTADSGLGVVGADPSMVWRPHIGPP